MSLDSDNEKLGNNVAPLNIYTEGKDDEQNDSSKPSLRTEYSEFTEKHRFLHKNKLILDEKLNIESENKEYIGSTASPANRTVEKSIIKSNDSERKIVV